MGTRDLCAAAVGPGAEAEPREPGSRRKPAASRVLTNVGPSRARRFGTSLMTSEGFAARRGSAALAELRRAFATKRSARRSGHGDGRGLSAAC